jgi:hypothetical protein
MSDLRRFDFFSKERRDPYIKELIEYNLTKTEGFIHFDGYYYVANEEFPIRTFLNSSLRKEVSSDEYEKKYKLVEDKYYMIEIYNREKIENTSSYDEVEEEDGSKMSICYFPTHTQKLYFKIIQEYDSFEEFLDGCKEYFGNV